jgi:DNA-binding NtrC family response regulator
MAIMGKDCTQNGALRVLVVDDDPGLLNLFSQILRKEGYDLATADNARDALRLIDECPHRPHLLISDVEMPGMSGTELARRMAAEHSDVPVLLMSGSPLPSNVDFPFLIKPFTTPEFLEKIRDVMDESTAHRNRRSRVMAIPVKAAVACLSIATLAGFATWLWLKKTPSEAMVQRQEIPVHRVESA